MWVCVRGIARARGHLPSIYNLVLLVPLFVTLTVKKLEISLQSNEKSSLEEELKLFVEYMAHMDML